jgi:hypothetical protein
MTYQELPEDLDGVDERVRSLGLSLRPEATLLCDLPLTSGPTSLSGYELRRGERSAPRQLRRVEDAKSS